MDPSNRWGVLTPNGQMHTAATRITARLAAAVIPGAKVVRIIVEQEQTP